MATAVLPIVGCVAPIVASAEETQESVESVELENVSTEAETSENQANIVEETDTSKWFDETIKPMLIQYGASVVAFVTAVLMMLSRLNKTGSTLGVALGALTKANADYISTAQAVTDMKAEFQAEYERQKAENDTRMAEMAEMFVNALKELNESLTDKVVDIDEVAHKLLDVEMLAYGDNSKLVSNGTAKRIAEVVNNGKIKNQE
jgi:hypothetical protein